MPANRALGRLGGASRTAARSAVAFTGRAARVIATPPIVERLAPRTGRLGQWLAALFLVVLVPLSFRFIIIGHNISITFLNIGPWDAADQAPFFVTLITFFFLCFWSWLWFQWVRSAGFGLMNVYPREDA